MTIMSTTHLNIRIDTETKQDLGRLASLTDRPVSHHVKQALHDYLSRERAYLEAVEQGIAAAENGDFATPEQMQNILEKYSA